MQSDAGTPNVLTVNNLTEFFRDALGSALADQHLSVEIGRAHV